MTLKTQTRTVDREKLKKQLIAFGKKKGHVTYDELHELLPPDLIDPEELGEWEKTLVDEGVQVLSREEAKDAAKPKLATRKVMPKRDEEGEDEPSRTNDPVRMYLRKMGSVSLLTREGEVEIAKRIEQGEMRVLDIALASPVAVPFILDMYDRIRRGQMRVKDVLNISNPAENGPGMPPGAEIPSINQEAAMDNLHKQVEKIRRHQKEVDKLKGILLSDRKVGGPDGAPAGLAGGLAGGLTGSLTGSLFGRHGGAMVTAPGWERWLADDALGPGRARRGAPGSAPRPGWSRSGGRSSRSAPSGSWIVLRPEPGVVADLREAGGAGRVVTELLEVGGAGVAFEELAEVERCGLPHHFLAQVHLPRPHEHTWSPLLPPRYTQKSVSPRGHAAPLRGRERGHAAEPSTLSGPCEPPPVSLHPTPRPRPSRRPTSSAEERRRRGVRRGITTRASPGRRAAVNAGSGATRPDGGRGGGGWGPGGPLRGRGGGRYSPV